MALETGTYISDLVATNPVGATDQKLQGDDHLRLIKSTILATFPNITGAMTSTHTELNILDGATLSTTELNYVDGVTSAIQTQFDSRALSLSWWSGLVLSNDTDTDHDINITAGSVVDSGRTVGLTLSSEMTKQLDAAWAAGDDAGGLFSGSIANSTWYHVFLIQKDSDGSIDAGFDTSVTAANIPAGYTAYRRIGSVLTDGSANIRPFTQFGDRFTFNSTVTDVSAAAQGTSAITRTLSTPLGVKVLAHLFIGYRDTAATNTYIYLSDLAKTDQAASNARSNIQRSTNFAIYSTGETDVLTNTSSQIRSRASAANGILNITVAGWTDRRGK